jgi:hypothetical protein
MAYAEDEKKLINTMQRQGIIQKSSSPWSNPLVLVMKKNGKIRPCVDYRRLNSVTKKDALKDLNFIKSDVASRKTANFTNHYYDIYVKTASYINIKFWIHFCFQIK